MANQNNFKKQLIQIDLKSIRKNKNAGNSITTVPGREEITFSGTGDIPKEIINFEKEKKLFLSQYETDNNGVIISYNGIIFDWIIIEEIKQQVKNIFIEQNIDYIKINHLPISTYSHKYDSETIITCNECGAILKYGELLEEEYDYNDDDYAYTDKKCPICKEWNCVNLEFETIEQALERKIS